MMEAERDEEGNVPTLVMGASIVMEWIRAIDECLRCELPGRRRERKKNHIDFQQTESCVVQAQVR